MNHQSNFNNNRPNHFKSRPLKLKKSLQIMPKIYKLKDIQDYAKTKPLTWDKMSIQPLEANYLIEDKSQQKKYVKCTILSRNLKFLCIFILVYAM